MTKIRLARTGSTHLPSYRIVVVDSRSRRDGKFIEILGSYDPRHKTLNLNQERAAYWVSVGAQPTNTTITLLTKAGVKHPFTVRRKPARQPKNPSAVTETAVAVEESAAEATAEEAPTEASAEVEATEAVHEANAEQTASETATSEVADSDAAEA